MDIYIGKTNFRNWCYGNSPLPNWSNGHRKQFTSTAQEEFAEYTIYNVCFITCDQDRRVHRDCMAPKQLAACKSITDWSRKGKDHSAAILRV